MIVVLVVAAGAAWESWALKVLGAHPEMVVLKRCVDVDDLLAAASSGQAEVAVIGLDAPGLDATAVDLLRRQGVRPVAVVPADRIDVARLRASRIGISVLVGDDELDALPEAVRSRDEPPVGPRADEAAVAEEVPATGPGERGRLIVVWGPAGAPGRSTVAAAVAADLARRGRRTILVDADPYGGSLAQQLGIMDEVSGLLVAARLSVAGRLEQELGSVQRSIDHRLSVITGLPRPDRWTELRPDMIEHLLETARERADVVVDTGFCLEDDPSRDLGGRPSRNQLTLGALEVADEILVVGAADPVGLSRLARGLVDLADTRTQAPVRVVVNRMRPSLGWSEKDIAGMVAGFVRPVGLHFLPEDRAAVDRALVAGRTLVESGDSPLVRAVTALVDAMGPPPGLPPDGRSVRRPGRGPGRRTGRRLRPRTTDTTRRP